MLLMLLPKVGGELLIGEAMGYFEFLSGSILFFAGFTGVVEQFICKRQDVLIFFLLVS